ncbi:hypothetical protein [Streptomyces sp. NPDC055912]|uniref:hypothetical protein n=1 Tax=unclassified Streptomyces TaxID=2593676 RepID=UPI0035DA246F
MVAAVYSVSAVRIKDGERANLLRFHTTTDLAEVPGLLEAYAADFAEQGDVLVDMTSTPTA